MRRILFSKNPDEVSNACSLLDQAQIEYTTESSTITDWEDEGYGDILFSLWVRDENDRERANELLLSHKEFLRSPSYHPPEKPPQELKAVLLKKKPFWTYFLLFICSFFFFIDLGSSLAAPASEYPSVTAFSPIKKTLLFDYPRAIALRDNLIEKEVSTPLTSSADPAIKELYKTPFWGGISLTLFAHITGLPILPHPSTDPHLLFEKIRQGEVWRLFSPALLHGSFLHLLFNMAWLYILGKQIEQHLGGVRFLSFIILTGILSNTAQYLMGGYAFLGFSGILFAMAAFIAARQRLFPNEGFFIEKGLYNFLKGTIFFFIALSLTVFIAECYLKQTIFSVGLANAAHVAGLLSGMWIGTWQLFSTQRRQNHPQN